MVYLVQLHQVDRAGHFPSQRFPLRPAVCFFVARARMYTPGTRKLCTQGLAHLASSSFPTISTNSHPTTQQYNSQSIFTPFTHLYLGSCLLRPPYGSSDGSGWPKPACLSRCRLPPFRLPSWPQCRPRSTRGRVAANAATPWAPSSTRHLAAYRSPRCAGGHPAHPSSAAGTAAKQTVDKAPAGVPTLGPSRAGRCRHDRCRAGARRASPGADVPEHLRLGACWGTSP